ncbi:MAG: chemotaxis response regulator protein-glutamate methylesterase [gamma proteobacterium symbiont of Taylorina sp.]|nr:chemotaxis response regulator protein-glutamate methylesterase [gamma proteobacterium symbiont of Taylorina sp.]
MAKIKVMVVDDSALVRKLMTELLNTDRDIEVIAQAPDPVFALEKLKKIKPDVITLDIEMPRMDGVTFLGKLMSTTPIPVVICSSLAEDGAKTTLEAIKNGAVDIITKPRMGVKGFLKESSMQIIDAVKGAARSRVRKRVKPLEIQAKNTADVILAHSNKSMTETTEKIIAIGASTGGTQALRDVLSRMPAVSPGILIVQHMPEKFTTAFAEHLNDLSEMDISEAKKGDRLIPGKVLIAPGGQHMLLKRSGAFYQVDVIDGPLVSRHRPSVDVLFRSVARYAGRNAVGCLMTGMGDDGAQGLLEMKNAGSRTISQDEASSVVYGMPQEAWKKGASEAQISLNKIPQTLLDACAGKRIK